MAKLKAGRPRKQAPRYPNGSVHRHELPYTPELILRRAEGIPPEHAMSQEAGNMLGRLMLCGKITERQHQAGGKYRRCFLAWASNKLVPYRHPRVLNGRSGGDVVLIDAEELAKINERMQDIRDALRWMPDPDLAMRMLEDICVDDRLSYQSRGRVSWSVAWVTFLGALELLARHFKIK